MYYVSKNTFTLLVHKDSEKMCTVISINSGKIYRCSASQIFNTDSKKSIVKPLGKQKVNVEFSLYNLIMSAEAKGNIPKNVNVETYREMCKKLRKVNSYAWRH